MTAQRKPIPWYRNAGLILAVGYLCAGIAPTALAERHDAAQDGIVIDLAGRQRMLTQKMSKEFFLIALDYDAGNNQALLTKTCDLFDRTLTGLPQGDAELGLLAATQPKTLKQLQRVAILWTHFEPALRQGAASGTIDDAMLKLIATGNPVLLDRMNTAVQLLEREAARLQGRPGPTS